MNSKLFLLYQKLLNIYCKNTNTHLVFFCDKYKISKDFIKEILNHLN